VHDAAAAIRPPWRPLRELLDSPAGWQERINAVRAALASNAPAGTSVPMRVATSVAQLGVVARLVAPALGAAVIMNQLLPLGPDEVWWQDRLGGPFPLSVPGRAGEALRADPDQLAAALVDGLLTRIIDVTTQLSVSPQILWGNVASALNGAAAMIARARPDLAASTAATAGGLLSVPPLRHAWDGQVGQDFRRRSCCLIYQLSNQPRRAVCGDCVLIDDRE
jgi:ferric iron reductase protein FhuF